MAVLTSPEDIVNAALVRIGWKKSIGSLFDGSDESSAALNIYGQTRDEQLRLFDWGFAERNAALSLLKLAPVGGYNPPLVWSSAYPILPWVFEYAYPSDCLKVRALRTTSVFIPEFDPAPVVFRIANDNGYAPSKKVILCNIQNAICVYTGQVTDPSLWEASFTESLIAALADRLSPALANLQTKQASEQDEAIETTSAEMKLG